MSMNRNRAAGGAPRIEARHWTPCGRRKACNECRARQSSGHPGIDGADSRHRAPSECPKFAVTRDFGQQKTGLEGRFLSDYWWRSVPPDETRSRAAHCDSAAVQPATRGCAARFRGPAAERDPQNPDFGRYSPKVLPPRMAGRRLGFAGPPGLNARHRQREEARCQWRYVFERSGGSWTQIDKLQPPTLVANARYRARSVVSDRYLMLSSRNASNRNTVQVCVSAATASSSAHRSARKAATPPRVPSTSTTASAAVDLRREGDARAAGAVQFQLRR
jgi:hypothetical protein